MTSPIGSKPSQTVKDYETVHGQGSRFGQDLDEAKVRKLLSNRVSNPFTKAAANFVQTINQVVNDIAEAIRGKGAGYSVISGAVDERLGPIDTAISESGKQFTQLADKVDEAGRVQDGLIKDNKKAIADAKTALDAAETNRTDLEAFNKQISDKVVTLTTDADNALKKADAISKKQSEIISNADKQKRVVDQAVLDLTTVTDDFNTYKTAQAETVRKLTARADKGIADAKTANDAIAKTNRELSANIAAGVAASEDVKKAKSDASKAATDVATLDSVLKDTVDIGASLVPLVPGTRTPTWTTHGYLNVSTGEYGTPVAGLQVVTLNNPRRTNFVLPEQYVKVSDKVRYKVSFWIRSENGPSSFLLGMRTPGSSAHPIDTSSEEGLRPTENNDPGVRLTWKNGAVIGLSQIDSTWRRAEYTVKFLPGTEYVSFYKIWWSYNGAGGIAEQQWIADLRIEPEIPDQATIDRLQNEAILKNEKVGSTNATAIEVMEESWKAQLVVNENQAKWNDGARNAINALTKQQALDTQFQKEQQKWNDTSSEATKALSRATKLLAKPNFGHSLIAYEQPSAEVLEDPGAIAEWRRPEWVTLRDASNDSPLQGGVKIVDDSPWMVEYTGPPKLVALQTTRMPVKPGVEYVLSFDAKGESGFGLLVSTDDRTGIRSVRQVLTDEEGRAYYKPLQPYSWLTTGQIRLTDTLTRHTFLLEFEDNVTEANLAGAILVYDERMDEKAMVSQTFGNIVFEPNVPTQAQVDKAQTDAIDSLSKSAALSKQFQEEQRRVNDLTQSQLWLHQDMIEFLDIRTPKTFGWDVRNVPKNYEIPWAPKFSSMRNGMPVYEAPSGYKMTSPYFDMYSYETSSNGYVYIGFKGQVEGMFDLEINWSSGVVDNWTLPMSQGNKRIYSFTGGATHISMRSIQVTLYISSLKREVRATGSISSKWSSVKDPNNLVREVDGEYIRFRNAVVCDKMVNRKQGRAIPAGQVIWGEEVRGSYLDDTVHTFTEVSEDDFTYTVPDADPDAGRNSSSPIKVHSEIAR